MMRKEIKQINKAYDSRFKTIQKDLFIDRSAGLNLFIEYLKYVRDTLILTEYNCEAESSKIKIATVCAAISEFEAYQQRQEVEQKTFHWNNFCELFKQNMEGWLKIDDSV